MQKKNHTHKNMAFFASGCSYSNIKAPKCYKILTLFVIARNLVLDALEGTNCGQFKNTNDVIKQSLTSLAEQTRSWTKQKVKISQNSSVVQQLENRQEKILEQSNSNRFLSIHFNNKCVWPIVTKSISQKYPEMHKNVKRAGQRNERMRFSLGELEY